MDLLVGIVILMFVVIPIFATVLSANRKQSNNSTGKQKSDAAQILDFEDSLEYEMDMLIKFINAYKKACHNEWVILSINCDSIKDVYNIQYDLKIDLKLGDNISRWQELMKYENPKILDYMTSTFDYDANEGKFSYRLFVGSGSAFGPPTILQNKLNAFLDRYEKKHSSIKFNRGTGSAYYRFS